MKQNAKFSKLLYGRTDLFKFCGKEVSLHAHVARAQAGAVAVASAEDSREGDRLKDTPGAPADTSVGGAGRDGTAQAVSLPAGPLGPGDRFKGKISGSKWNWTSAPAPSSAMRAKMQNLSVNLSEYQGFFFVVGEGLPAKGLYCPANYYRDRLVQLVLGEEGARFMTGQEGLERLKQCFQQFINTEVTGEITSVVRGIEGRELLFDGALRWLPAEARQRLERNTSLQSLFSSSCLPSESALAAETFLAKFNMSPGPASVPAVASEAVSSPLSSSSSPGTRVQASAAAPDAVPTPVPSPVPPPVPTPFVHEV